MSKAMWFHFPKTFLGRKGKTSGKSYTPSKKLQGLAGAAKKKGK